MPICRVTSKLYFGICKVGNQMILSKHAWHQCESASSPSTCLPPRPPWRSSPAFKDFRDPHTKRNFTLQLWHIVVGWWILFSFCHGCKTQCVLRAPYWAPYWAPRTWNHSVVVSTYGHWPNKLGPKKMALLEGKCARLIGSMWKAVSTMFPAFKDVLLLVLYTSRIVLGPPPPMSNNNYWLCASTPPLTYIPNWSDNKTQKLWVCIHRFLSPRNLLSQNWPFEAIQTNNGPKCRLAYMTHVAHAKGVV